MTVVVTPSAGQVIVTTVQVASPAVTVSPRTVQITPTPSPVFDVTWSPRTVEITNGGMQGPPGTDGDKHYRHVQGSAAATWIVDHNLDKYPAVQVVDSGGTQVEGDVQHVSQQRAIVTFNAAFAGQAFLN